MTERRHILYASVLSLALALNFSSTTLVSDFLSLSTNEKLLKCFFKFVAWFLFRFELSLNFHPLTIVHSRSNFKPSFNFYAKACVSEDIIIFQLLTSALKYTL